MKRGLGLSVVLVVAQVAHAADIDAGKEMAATLCAACHGANGVSVSDTIPNLAAQRTGYLEAQLKAFKDGTRKQPGATSPTAIMNAIATQLSADNIANVAAYFASQPGAATHQVGVAVERCEHQSDLPRRLQRLVDEVPHDQLPRDQAGALLLRQLSRDGRGEGGQAAARRLGAVRRGVRGELDADNKPITGGDGFYVADKLLLYTAMAREEGWGKDIPEKLRNENWNYAVFTTDKQHRPGVNQAECLACHKPLDNVSYTFTLKQLTEAK